MADTVQYHLERMLPELEDLEKRELFARSEIKEIVRKRRDFEYALKRHSVLKEDFFRYVEYETQLEALRRDRKEVLCKKLRSTGQSWRTSLCDRSSAMRIMLIYERAVTKFKGDISLWLNYLEYCRAQGSRRVQKVMMKALQLHSTVPGLWVYASVWESEQNSNVTAARALMQQGLRLCPKSEVLWLEYFRMELIFAQKLKARRLILGLDPARDSLKVQDACATADNGEDPHGQVLESRRRNSEASEGQKTGRSLAAQQTLGCKIARSIFQNAVGAIPDSPTFRQRFIEVAETFDLEQLEAIEDDIYASLNKDFPKDENSWSWLAKRHCIKGQKRGVGITESRRKAIQVYDEALLLVPSPQMYELYAQFLVSVLDDEDVELKCDDREEMEQANRIEAAADSLLGLYNRARTAGIVTETLAEGHVNLHLRWGKVEEARKLAGTYCRKGAPLCGSARLWALSLSLETRSVGLLGLDSIDEVAKVFREALKLSTGDTKVLWQMAVEVLAGHERLFGSLLQTLETALASEGGKQAGGEVASALINWVLQAEGFQRAREIYTRLLALPCPNLELFKACITMEAQLTAAGNTEAFTHLRKIFNAAIVIYGQTDEELWLEFCQQERKAGNIEAANAVYWRAKKTLSDPSLFLQRHQLL